MSNSEVRMAAEDKPAMNFLISNFPRSVVFDIDNVAEYFHVSSGQLTHWKAADFPNIAPPFTTFWMEFTPRLPEGYQSSGLWDRAGVLFAAVDRDEVLNPSHVFPKRVVRLFDKPSCKWFVQALVVTEYLGQPPELMATFDWPVAETGEWAYTEESWEVSMHTVGSITSEEDRVGLSTWLRYLVYPCLLALSLMHCKNVVTVLNEPKLNRAARRRKEKPLVKYYTLEIEPMKQILRTEGGIEQVGLKKALHICRGHFKDYRERGLFGKKKGIFWWDHHVRGQLSEGAVVKDYAVKAP